MHIKSLDTFQQYKSIMPFGYKYDDLLKSQDNNSLKYRRL